MKSFLPASIALVLAFVTLAGCSSDSDCPTCATCPQLTQWAAYDSLNDNSFDGALWGYSTQLGGRVLETNGQLQVWGNTGTTTGIAVLITVEARLAWRFDLVEVFHDEGPSCQGWYVTAIDPTTGAGANVLTATTVGCSPDWNDTVGTYEIRHEGDSLAVYRNGSLLRRVYGSGIDAFRMQFTANNFFGSGDYSHIFIDDVWCLLWKP